MEAAVLKLLENRRDTIFDQNSNMNFEWYATGVMIDLLNTEGLPTLLDHLNGAINATGIDPIAKMFFMDILKEISRPARL